MKLKLLILFLLPCFLAAAQNEKVLRDPFKLTLVYDSLHFYEEEIKSTPYLVRGNSLQLYPSEKVFLEVELNGDAIESLKSVREIQYPDQTITLGFSQESDGESDPIMMLKIDNPFVNRVLTFSGYIYKVNGNGWERTSLLPVQAQSSSIEIWSEVISSIGIDGWNLEYQAKENIKKVMPESTTLADRKANMEAWLNEKNINLNELPLANPENIIYNCDSLLLLKEKKGDTTIMWMHGLQVPLDTTSILRFVEGQEYGKTAYLREVYKSGKVNGVRLMPYTFYTHQDSLFELETIFTINLDSLIYLSRKITEFYEDEEKSDVYRDLIDANSYDAFKLIYHPDIFVEEMYNGNRNKDEIRIINRWRCKDQAYFEIEISDGYSGNGRKYTFIFDEDYNWVKYDTCNQGALDCLKKENLVPLKK